MGLLCNPTNPENNDLATVFCVIDRAIKMAAGIASLIALLFILWGAYQYFTAYGNEEKANKGRTIVMWSVIGIIIILLSSVIVNLVYKSLV